MVHDECINLSRSEINQILIYFCPCCLNNDKTLKIVHQDYSKEHTKPLFKKHDILTIYNLFPYHSLLELYKILKFRIPYSLYELFTYTSQKGSNIVIRTPIGSLRCQRQAFTYQAVIFWNKLHKQILIPSKVKLHDDYKTKLNLLDSECIFYDLSTKVTTFKSNLKRILHNTQSNGDEFSWTTNNYLSNT